MSGIDRPRDRAPLAPLQPVRRVRRAGERHGDCDADARGQGRRDRKIPPDRGPEHPGHLIDELV